MRQLKEIDMIEASELRISNLILLEVYPDLPRPHKVMPKDIYDIAEGRITLSAIDGLPLTREILENNPIPIGRDKGSLIADMIADKEIKFLHQYQNIVFALTGKELKVNLKANELLQHPR